jgi:hypothetical protein
VAGPLPAITGRQLQRLLRLAGWRETGRRTHGIGFAKADPDGRVRVTVVPDRRRPLTSGTLAAILGPQQTNIGRDGLASLIERYGLK